MDVERGGAALSFLGACLSARFRMRELAIPPHGTLRYRSATWADALVVVERGELEVETVAGERRRFGHGSVLCLAGLRLRSLRNPGDTPCTLSAVSRRTRRPAPERAEPAGDPDTSGSERRVG
jgi:quercetin dioxygenase-like cupin family protein